MHVHIATQISEVDEAGEGTLERGLDLPAHLSQLRRDPLEAERRVDVFLALAGDAHIVFGPEQAVFVQQIGRAHV